MKAAVMAQLEEPLELRSLPDPSPRLTDVVISLQLLLLCLCFAIISFAGSITVRLLPVYAVRLGADSAMTGLYVALSFLTVTLGNIFGGWLSDRLGTRKPILIVGCAAWIPTVLLMTQATDIPRLILTTGLSWLPGGMVLATVNSLTALTAARGERGKVFGASALASGLGALLAGSLGGLVAERWGFATLFVVMAAAIALLLVVAMPIQDRPTPRPDRQTRTQHDAPGGPATSVGRVLTALLAAQLLVRLATLIGGLGIPLAMTRQAFDVTAVSSTITVSSALTLPLPLFLGWLSDRAGRRRLLVACYALGALGLLVLLQGQLLWQFWVSASLLAIIDRSTSVTQALVADAAPPEAMGRAMSWFNTSSLFAGVLGLGGAGYVMQTIGITPTLVLTACLPLVAIGVLLRLRQPLSRASYR